MLLFSLGVLAQGPLTAKELLALKSAGNLQISPDGTEVLYSVSTPRGPNEEPGGSHTAYFRMKIKDGTPTPLFDEGIIGSSPMYSPDGKYIGFLHKGKGEANQVWYMNSQGGEISKLTNAPGAVSSFRWHPGKKGIAYLSKSPDTEKEKALKKRGYGFIFYEENLKNHELFLAEFDSNWEQTDVKKLTEGVQTWDFEFNSNGSMIAATITPANLIDQKYMLRRIYLVDTKTGKRTQISKNEGKLGNDQFSPDGTRLVYAAALNLNPILQRKELGKQELILFSTRDEMEIEGIVIHPVGYESGQKYPLVVYVHGGPESHHSNGWLSRYSTPGQVMAGKGYLLPWKDSPTPQEKNLTILPLKKSCYFCV